MDQSKKLAKIGEKIRALRIKKGWESYEVFSYDNEIPTKTMWRAEKGFNINMETFLKILQGLGVTMEEFSKGIK